MGTPDATIIGRIEKRLPVVEEVFPMRKPVAISNSAVPERAAEAASAVKRKSAAVTAGFLSSTR